MPLPLEIHSQSALLHVLTHRPDRIQRLTVHGKPDTLNPRLQELVKLARAAHIVVDFASRAGKDEEPVRAVLAPYVYADFKGLVESLGGAPRCVLLALDHLQDTQNFGALCRSAEGLGVRGVIIPKDRSVTVTAGVYHASVGAVDTLPIAMVSNIGEALRKLKDQGFWIVGAALAPGATAAEAMPDFEKIVLVLGSELDGLSTSVGALCDWKLQIPLKGKIESLNVGSAGAILIHELCRRGG